MKSYQEDTADPDFENYEPRDEIDPDDMETIICSFVNDTGGELSWDQVGRNPLAHSEVLEFLFELSQSMPWDLDVLVANNPHCDESLLARLSHVDSGWETTSVRIGVACNPSTPGSLLEAMWSSPWPEQPYADSDLAWCLARNPRTPEHVLLEIAQSRFMSESSLVIGQGDVEISPVAYALAENPATPIAVLEALVQRGDAFVPGEWSRKCLQTAQANLDCHRARQVYVPDGSVAPSRGDAIRWRFYWS